jgi:dTDP-4-dehydrorhamnose 3,5-epimerase-like enzyme
MKEEIGRIIQLPKVEDVRGNLTFIEENRHIPFEIKRVYYLYDVPGGESRGGHAHKQLQQFIIAATGSFDVILDGGSNQERYNLNRSYYGLYIPPMVWREIDNFSSGSVCLVLVSDYFDEEDYIREHDVFMTQVRAQQKDLNEYSGGSLTLEKVVTISQRRESTFHDSAED